MERSATPGATGATSSETLDRRDQYSVGHAEIRERMNYHAPTPEAAEAHRELSTALERALLAIDRIVPPGREKSVAVTKIEEAKFWASAGVARKMERLVHGEDPQREPRLDGGGA